MKKRMIMVWERDNVKQIGQEKERDNVTLAIIMVVIATISLLIAIVDVCVLIS